MGFSTNYIIPQSFSLCHSSAISCHHRYLTV